MCHLVKSERIGSAESDSEIDCRERMSVLRLDSKDYYWGMPPRGSRFPSAASAWYNRFIVYLMRSLSMLVLIDIRKGIVPSNTVTLAVYLGCHLVCRYCCERRHGTHYARILRKTFFNYRSRNYRAAVRGPARYAIFSNWCKKRSSMDRAPGVNCHVNVCKGAPDWRNWSVLNYVIETRL